LDDLALALELADAADEITVGHFGVGDLAVETKPDMTPVSEADTATEQALRDRLAQARPGDAVVGEEYGDAPSSQTGDAAGSQSGDGPALETGDRPASQPARRWIIDPIDGTKNYLRGVPVWATLLALEVDGEIVVGVVSAPALGRRWWASRGGGAFASDGRNESAIAITVSGVVELGDAQLSFSGLEEWDEIGRLDALISLARRCWRTRGYGDFWGYMLVAEGAVEIGVEPVVELWDLAAPKVIVEEAGGRFTDLAGNSTPAGGDAIATNALVHDAALAVVGRRA
jgi:histidinol-phosphatase